MTAASSRVPEAAPPTSVAIDVVSLPRMARLAAEYGPVLDRMLLHPVERDAARGSDGLRRLSASFATKESWIKSCGGRPAGWTLDRGAFLPCECSAVPDGVQALIGTFAGGLDVTDIQAGAIHGDFDLERHDGDASGSGASGMSGGHWAWHGVFEHWLIAAVLT